MKLIDKDFLMNMGLKQNTAESVIRQAKVKMVESGYPFYTNRKVTTVPATMVESIIGVPLGEVPEDEDS